jgi:hypothetical protein
MQPKSFMPQVHKPTNTPIPTPTTPLYGRHNPGLIPQGGFNTPFVWNWKYPVQNPLNPMLFNKTPTDVPTVFPLLIEDRQTGTSRPVIWCDPILLSSLTPAQRETMERLISQFNSLSLEERAAIAKKGAPIPLTVGLARDCSQPTPQALGDADDDPFDLAVNPVDPRRLGLLLPAW